MNDNPPPYPGPGPSGYPPYPQQQYVPGPYPGYPPTHGAQPAYPGYPPSHGAQPVYPGHPQYGWGNEQQPGAMYTNMPKSTPNTVYVVQDQRRNDDSSACLTACWTALRCCCLWDMLT
uniref:Cysteine-rich and transmembrane domain-containing protein 1 n=1 Tax=Callorhinchus milii TaxID=7868 RepID=K4FSI6_CALMI|nr:UPF0467 protein C5orf32-like protein [Callorhinchus milii]